MASDRTLIQIRERSFLDLLDLALIVIRARPLPILAAALAGILPCAAFNALITHDIEFPLLLFLDLLLLELPWAMAPLTIVMGGLMFGETPSIARVARELTHRLPAMFVYQFVMRIPAVLMMFLYPFFPSRLTFLEEVILLEDNRFSKMVGRSLKLSRVRGGDYFSLWVISVFLGAAFLAAFWVGTGAVISSLFTSELTWYTPAWSDMYGIRFQVGMWVVLGFFSVVRFLCYIDQRIRLEGWEVKLRLMAAARTLKEASRW